MHSFIESLIGVFSGLVVSAVVVRVLWSFWEGVSRAPVLDIVVSLFTWLPWVAGGVIGGWSGVAGAIVAQLAALHGFCLIHRAVRGKEGRTLTDAQGRVLGPVRNQLCLLVQTPAIFVFVQVRLAEIVLYPPIAWLGKLPTYRQAEWVNLSRHKFRGLAGYDLLWCWYCDWMTGLWALGSDMLRNIESFWCPIQFLSPEKNRNAAVDFPDLEKWAPPDATIDDAVKIFEAHYDGQRKNSWWGHPDRR